MEKKVEKYDVVIVGGGASGLTAGIYCGRARLKTLIIEQALVGGIATNTNEIENYPGFPEGYQRHRTDGAVSSAGQEVRRGSLS